MSLNAAQTRIADDVALKTREEIDDLVAESAIRDALARLQDFVRDFAPTLKKEVLLLRARHNEWRSQRRQGLASSENISTIRLSLLDLADQTYDEAAKSREPALRLVVDNDAPPPAPEPEIVSAPEPAAERQNVVRLEQEGGEGALDELRRRYFRALRQTRDMLVCSSKDITRSYARGGFALEPVSLELHAGEITGIVGRNGSGKTTLLRLLMGELKPNGGVLSYPTLSPNAGDWARIKRQIAYVAQLPDRWQGRLRNNLNFVAAANARPGQDVRELVDWNVARYDLERYADATWDEISGGYKIRFELVRALVSQPKLLFLDEPLAYLDVIARQRFLKDIETIATSIENPIPIVITSQHLHEIEAIADQMVLLEDGVCRYAGPIEGIGQLLSDRVVEISLRTSRRNLETALQGLGLREVERTMEGFILAFAKGVDLGAVLQRLRAAFGDDFSAFRDITNSARALMSEDIR